MPHPTVPDLRAFSATVRPNLMNGGPYDQQLTAIEEYLASLGDYVDAELARIESEIVSSSRGPACWVIYEKKAAPTALDARDSSTVFNVSQSGTALAGDTAIILNSYHPSPASQPLFAMFGVYTIDAEFIFDSTLDYTQENDFPELTPIATYNMYQWESSITALTRVLGNIKVGDYLLISGLNGTNPTSPACENIMAEASSASTVAAEALEDAETATKNISTVAGEVASQAETLSTHTTQLSAIQSQLDEDASSLGELGNEINTLSAWQEKVAAIAADVPTGVDAEDGTALKVASKALLNADGSAGAFFPALKNLLGSLMLAAPNDDQTQVLGYLGDGTDDLTASSQVRSSAALTAAYESGGSGGTSGLRLVKNGINNVLYDGDDPVTNLTLTANQAGNLTSNYAYMAPEGFVAATEQEESQFLTTQYAAGGFVITNPATTEDIALTVLDTLPTAQITADDLTTMKRSGSFVFMDTAVS